MALTISTPNSNPEAHVDDIIGRLWKTRIRVITFDDTYAAGGESFVPSDVGLSEFLFVSAQPDDAGYVVTYDYTSETLRVFGVEQDADAAVTDPLDEENASADLSGLSVRVLVIGL